MIGAYFRNETIGFIMLGNAGRFGVNRPDHFEHHTPGQGDQQRADRRPWRCANSSASLISSI